MRKLIPIIFILCVAGAWGSIGYRNISIPNEYEKVLSDARESCEEGYYLEALGLLEEAEELQGSAAYEIEKLRRDIYYGMQNASAYESQLLSLIRNYPEEEENYEKLIGYYQKTENTEALCRLLPGYLEVWPENESMKQADRQLDMQYRYVETGYYDVQYASESLADIQALEYEAEEETERAARKLINSQGNTVFEAEYSRISVSQDRRSCFMCDGEGNWTRVDIMQNLLARNEEVSFSWIGSLSDNQIATAVIDGKYHFINEKMKVSDLTWEEAGTFRDGVNAVCRDGRWALVTTESWKDVAEFPYTQIPRNSRDCCVAEGYGVVADERGYYVIETEEFLPVSENIYEELKAFECSQPTAYRQGDKWGFVNRQGEIYLDACYEDAKPFINGYAAVKQDGLWGYIDRNQTMVIEPQFEEALNVMENGYAYVRNGLGYWDYVIIDRLYYTNRG